MSAPIEIALDAHEFHPGDQVSGMVVLGSDERARNARVELLYVNRFTVPPREPVGTAQLTAAPGPVPSKNEVVAAAATLPSAQGTHRIDLALPDDAPPSAHQEGLPRELEDLIAWQVRVSLDRARAPDRKQAEEIRVLSRSGELAQWADAESAPKSSECPIRVQPEVGVVRPGERLSGTMVLSPRQRIDARAVRVELEGRRNDFGMGLGRAEPSSEVRVSGPIELAASQTHSFPFELEVPPGVPPSFAAAHNEFHWYLVGVVDRKLRGDWTGEKEIVVYTGEEGGTQTDAVKEAELPPADLRAVIDRYRPRLGQSRIHVQPDIPSETLASALAKYAKGVAADEVMALVDTSVAGSGKSGLIVTPTTVFAHEPLRTMLIPLDEVDEVEVEGSLLKLNGDAQISTATIGESTEVLANMLGELAEAARASGPGGELDPHAVVARYRPRLGKSRIHVQPDIPRDKLENALAKYAKSTDPDEVIMLVDTSVLENGKAGLILTPTSVFAHEPLRTTQIAVDEIDDIKVAGSSLYVSGDNLISTNGIGDSAEVLAEVLRKLAAGARAKRPR